MNPDHTQPVAGLCDTCGLAVKPAQAWSFREVTCWEQIRPGGAGAGHRQSVPTGRVRCAACGTPPQTSPLF